MTSRSSLHHWAGFTLVEAIVTVAVSTLVLLTLGKLIVYFYQTNAYTLQEATAISQARRGVENAMRDLREASYGSDGSYPVMTAATSSLTFFANANADTAIERITYRLIRGTLYRTVVLSAGNPPSYVGGAISTSTVATSVVNSAATAVFQYFNEAGTLISTPVNISQIASIRTTLVVDVNVNRAPVSFTLTAGATLRNLKSQL